MHTVLVDVLRLIMSRHGIYSFIQKCVCLVLVVTIVVADRETCDETKCAGPLIYYKSLGCKPVYEKEGDCCAIRYNCDHLKERSKNKCYVNDKAYEINEKLKKEDANPCDFGCFCTNGRNGFASFNCPIVDCYDENIEPGCYMQNSPTKCCPGPLVCPENPEDRATCVMNGKIYKEGQRFKVTSDPELTCVCQKGYKEGENVAPFCAKPNRTPCDPYFRHAADVHQCAPVYYSEQPLQTSCNSFYRCQHNNDYVIHTHESHEVPEEECYFGDLTLHHYDELNRRSEPEGSCIKCVCEVPPVLTCVQLPADKCDGP